MSKGFDTFFPIVQKEHPTLHKEDIQFFDSGNDHVVYVVDNKLAYRFPRGENFGKKDVVENIFLQDFAKISPIKIQEMQEHTDALSHIHYQTYCFIPGVGFTKELAETITREECKVIAQELGKFLKKLHSYSLEKAKEMHMDSINSAKDYLDFFAGRLVYLRMHIFPALSEEVRQWIEKLFKVYLATSRELFIPRVTHFDMQPIHIIMNDETHVLSGVIDFSLRIADPARDFMYFNRYGDTFLQAAYSSYGEKDSYFEARRQFYAGELEILAVESAIDAKSEKEVKNACRTLAAYASEFPVL